MVLQFPVVDPAHHRPVDGAFEGDDLAHLAVPRGQAETEVVAERVEGLTGLGELAQPEAEPGPCLEDALLLEECLAAHRFLELGPPREQGSVDGLWTVVTDRSRLKLGEGHGPVFSSGETQTHPMAFQVRDDRVAVRGQDPRPEREGNGRVTHGTSRSARIGVVRPIGWSRSTTRAPIQA